MTKRVYTGGAYDFEKIVRSGAIISDKTELVYRLVHESEYVFLSRPRRFGKSLLCSQLQYYFQGRKELFANFKIAELEKDWTEYPVFSFSMSAMKELDVAGITRGIYKQLMEYTEGYDKEDSPGAVFNSLIKHAYKQTGRGVVIIIDEYDAPLISKVRSEKEMDAIRNVLLDFYQQIKECDKYIRFAFLTGITRFSNLSIFSALNNLNDISMLPQYATICGITQRELETVFKPDVEMLAKTCSMDYDATMVELKALYDGYHFCEDQDDEIYNPHSLTKSFQNQKISNYWFSSGTPTFLVQKLRKFNVNLAELSEKVVASSQMDASIDSTLSILPLLYQSGYLTIKEYDSDAKLYTLGFPNKEVQHGLMECLLRLTSQGLSNSDGMAGIIFRCLLNRDIDGAMQHFKAFFASIPYPGQANQHLADFANFEAYYQSMFFAIFSLFTLRVRTEIHTVKGRSDVVFYLADTTYVMELKLARDNDDPGQLIADAFVQMAAGGYATPYQKPGSRVVLIAAVFSHQTRTLEQWVAKELQ